MAKAIVFDIGGVLIELDPGRCIEAFQTILGFERITKILDPCHQKGSYGDMEAGILTADQFRQHILAESRPGCRPADVDAAMAALLVGMREDTVQTVKRLAGKYPLYLLSNNNPISMARTYEIMRENGIEPTTTFREEFISWKMKMLKPSREFYEEAVRRIGLPAGELLFIDDNQANVDGARAIGMQARFYQPGTDLSLLLADL
jgi:putative hydrolase of the HAD superfamily